MTKKPTIPKQTIANWQCIVDLMAEIANAPAGLIMRLEAGKSINVFVTSTSEGNVWALGDNCAINAGLYCEEVVNTREHLLILDAQKDPQWDHNPDLEYGMSFYLGFPLIWPDGEIFGTICVLDKKQNQAAIDYKDLIYQFKKVVEGDLQLLIEIAEKNEAQAGLLEIQKELEARVDKRTHALKKTNEGLRKEIALRKQTEKTLKHREAQLNRRTTRLKDTNTALRVLLENRDSAKGELEASMLANINELIIPYLHKLKKNSASALADHYVALIESSLNDITSTFSSDLVQKYTNLTPTEVRVINLIRQGKTTKEISGFMHTATSTVDFHRANIRKKIGLKGRRVNLQTHFQSSALN